MTAAYGTLVCASRGYHDEEKFMPVTTCGHCSLDSAGNHSPSCPLHSNNRPQSGWICPKCGVSNAPSVKQCLCSPSESTAPTKKLLFG